MAWPTTTIPINNLDAGGDSPQAARADILQTAQQVNDMRDHLQPLGSGVAAGTWSPAVSNVTNASAPVPLNMQYMRLGNVVHVAFAYQVATAAAGGATFNLSLPVPTDLTFSTQFMGAGVVSGSGGVLLPLRCAASSTSDTISVVFTAAAADTYTVIVTGLYTLA